MQLELGISCARKKHEERKLKYHKWLLIQIKVLWGAGSQTQ